MLPHLEGETRTRHEERACCHCFGEAARSSCRTAACQLLLYSNRHVTAKSRGRGASRFRLVHSEAPLRGHSSSQNENRAAQCGQSI